MIGEIGHSCCDIFFCGRDFFASWITITVIFNLTIVQNIFTFVIPSDRCDRNITVNINVKYCYGDQIKEDEMGGACSMHKGDDKSIRTFRRKI
jgi:hypothetical protein